MKFLRYRKYARYLSPLVAAGYNYLRGKSGGSGGGRRARVHKGLANRRMYRGKGSRTRTKLRKRRRGKGGKQDIWSGDSHVFVPTKARKTRLTRTQRDLATKVKTEYNQTGRITSNASTMGATFLQHFPIAVISDQVNKASLGNATSACYLMDMNAYITLMNQDANDCTVWIYTLILRNDAGAVGINPTQDWRDGIVDETGAATDYLLPYTSPFQSKKFTTRWKVHKVQKFVLSSGAQHIHHVIEKPMHKINKERFTNTGGTGTGGAVNGVNYLTSVTMIVTLGGLVNDQTVKTNVTFGQTAVDYACVWRYQSHGISDDQTIFYKNVTYPAITTSSLIQEKTGAVITDVSA